MHAGSERDISDKPPLDVRLLRVEHSHFHKHEAGLELLYCLKGKLNIVAGHQTLVLKEGEIFTVDCRDFHCLHAEEDNLLLSGIIDLTAQELPWEKLKYIYLACESICCKEYQIRPLLEVKKLLLTAAYIAASDNPGKDEELLVIARMIMDILLRYFDWFDYIDKGADPDEEQRERFRRISAYCQKNYKQKITASQLAEEENISRNYFSQLLAKTTFMGFSNLMNYVRCFEAHQLLIETALPAAEISFECGFSDPKYFYRQFKNWWGCTPQQLRNWHRDYSSQPELTRQIPPDIALPIIVDCIARRQKEEVLASADLEALTL